MNDEKIVMDEATLRAQHDDLVANMPEGVSHDTQTCPICTSSADEPTTSERGEMSDTKTYTQADIDAAVLEALKPVQKELEAFKASQEAEEVERRIAETKAESDTKISELQNELDTATLKADAAKKDYDDLLAFLNAEQEAADQAAEIAARRDARLVIVRDVATFTDEHIEKAADRWAALSDDEFNALVEDWKAISKKEPGTPGDLPNKTAMVASRQPDNDSRSALRDVMDLTLQRIPLADLR